MTPDEIREALTEVRDPEIPVLNIVEMGIVRDVRLEGETVHVELTPTYTGCPAMRTIEEAIVQTLRGRGFREVVVHKVFREPWTTDWMTNEAREKLRAYGITPPPPRAEEAPELIPLPFVVAQRGPAVPCPFCGSKQTRQTSAFGPTACKALFFCEACQQPFEYFKAI